MFTLWINIKHEIWVEESNVDFITILNLFSKLLLKLTSSRYIGTKIVSNLPKGVCNIIVTFPAKILKHIEKMCTNNILMSSNKLIL